MILNIFQYEINISSSIQCEAKIYIDRFNEISFLQTTVHLATPGAIYCASRLQLGSTKKEGFISYEYI